MKNQVNIALQVIPISATRAAYDIIDDAIAVIRDSGLNYRVCPFETVIEGPYDRIMETVGKVQEHCFACGADELLVYVKIQNRKGGPVTIDEKMKKYR